MAEQQKPAHSLSELQDQSLILVAVMPSPRDLEIARVLGWYRIPYKFAPKIVFVDFLAFYQPSAFGNDKANQISIIAPVKGVELTTRRELFRDEPDHPRAEEEYYKIQIGALQALKKSIPAGKWKRVTFLYTTGLHLKTAEVINDLVVRDDERKMIFHSLRERQERFFPAKRDNSIELELDESLMLMLGGLQSFADDDGIYIDY